MQHVLPSTAAALLYVAALKLTLYRFLTWHTGEQHATDGQVHVASIALDEPGRAPPHEHIFWRSHVPWLRLGDNLPTHECDLPSAPA